jgi:beta-lactamase regulating signal transducer with metallopeptidase domain
MSEWAETLLRALLDHSIRIALVAVLAGAVLFVLRIRPGSVRHATWTAVLAAMLLMPVLSPFIPGIPIGLRIPSSHVETAVVQVPQAPPTYQLPPAVTEPMPTIAFSIVHTTVATRRPFTWPVGIFAIYLFGVVLLSVRMALGWQVMWSLVAGAREIRLESYPPFSESSRISTPVTIGILIPRILLPLSWGSWPKEKLRAILAHETAHIARRDPLIGFLARINCALFWFHPLSWRLQRQLATSAEHACDDVAIKTIGTPRVYAEILLDIAQAVRRSRGRFSWQATGVQGDGLLGERIDRILRKDHAPVSKVRKFAVAVSCALAIFVAVACRDESSTFARKGNIELEEQQAVARRTDARERILAQQNKGIAQMSWIRDSQQMTQEDANRLELDLKKDPENNSARVKLLFFYARPIQRTPADAAKAMSARRSHILWLIEHHPESELLCCSPITRIARGSAKENADAEGYEQAKQLWLAQTQRPEATTAVLSNAALFFEVSDKSIAETLLLRAKSMDSSTEWPIRLGRLYALALLGVDDAIVSRTTGPLGAGAGTLIRSIGLPEASSPFAQHVRDTLTASKDPQLLGSVGQYLMLHPVGRPLGKQYLERAVQLDPQLVSARQALLRMRSTDRYPETHAALRKVDKDQKYAAISMLPEPERFVILREMAEYSYTEANSLAVLDPDGAKAARERSKRYADDLLALAPKFRKDPDYSSAVFTANVLAGNIAAREGNNNEAVKYLRDASKIPPSEEMAYLPPSAYTVPYRQLCQILTGSGYRSDVVSFLEHFAEINISERDEILAMAADARAGKMGS